MNGLRLALVVTVLVVMACDGGSGSSSGALQGGVAPQGNTPQLSDINGSIQGMYFSSEQNGNGEWLNLETGESGSMFNGAIPRNLEVTVPAPNGTEYLESYGYKIVIKNWQTGLVVDEFDVAGDITSVASGIRFSPDGQIIGLFRDEFDTFDFTLAFFRRNGERIAEFPDDDVSDYEWLPDGRFVFYRNGELREAVLSQDSIRSRPLVSLENIPGSARNIKISPDGEYLVFEMVTGTPQFLSGSSYRNASVYRVKTDGTELSLVATMADTTGVSEPRVNNPMWSLDGNFLMMSVGVSASATFFWDSSYSSVTDDYEPLSISEVIVASSPGFMYVLPKDASNVVFLDGQSYPAIAHNVSGKPAPYQISALHIEPGAGLFDAEERLPETIVTPSGQTGSIIYGTNQFDNMFTVMEYDASAGEERILLQVTGGYDNNYDSASAFGVSSNKQLFAMWEDRNYDEMYLRIFDSTGTQRGYFQMVYYNSGPGGITVGRRLLSEPQFSPVNDDLLLFRYVDEDTGVEGFGVLDWTTGEYEYRREGIYQSVTWASDGSIVLSEDNNIHRLVFELSSNPDWQLLFSTVNPADSLDVNKQGTKLVFRMAGHLFHANMDGTDAVQITAPSAGYEYYPVWSPDGRNITLIKEGWRYIMSADSRHLQIYPGVETNTNRHQFVNGGITARGYWLP